MVPAGSMRSCQALSFRKGQFEPCVGLLPGFLGSLSLTGRRQFHARAPRLGQPDCDSLLRRPRAMLSLANMLDLFTNEFARLKREQQASTILPDSRQKIRLQGHVRLSLQQFGIRHCEVVAIQHYAALQENGAKPSEASQARASPCGPAQRGIGFRR